MTVLTDLLAVTRRVAITDCVHFCGYRYGRGEIHPYEQYAIALAAHQPVADVRRRFVEFLQRYRPRSLGQALGVDLSADYPLWALPWRTPRQVFRYTGWQRRARDVVDVMAWFSEEGIPRSVVDREFKLHESAFDSILHHGYQPRRHSFIQARELRGGERSAYLITDGNHRLAALSALGERHVEIRISPLKRVVRDQTDRWPLVRAGTMPSADALKVFDAYFAGNLAPYQSPVTADIV